MKRFFAAVFFLTALFNFTGCQGAGGFGAPSPSAPAAPREASAEPPAQAPDPGNILYAYDGYFSIELPGDWGNKYAVEENEYGPYFLSAANRDAGWGGGLFNIIGYDTAEWADQKEDIRAGMGLNLKAELGEANGKMFLLATPGDVNYDPNDEALLEEYNDMMSDIETIAASFKAL